MLVKKAVDREWKATDYSGIERSLFRNNEAGGRSSAVRLSRQSGFLVMPTRAPRKSWFSPVPFVLVTRN